MSFLSFLDPTSYVADKANEANVNGNYTTRTYNGDMDFHDGDGNFLFHNPGTIDLASANPELYAQLQKAYGYHDQFNQFAQDYTDPSRYDSLTDLYATRASTDLGNRYAEMGLGGSSMAMGAQNQAVQNVDQQMIERKLNDRLRLTQMNQLLSGSENSLIDTMQNRYSNFQNSMANFDTQQAIASSNANSALAQGIGSVVGTGVGLLAGGPAGGIIGGSLGGKLGGGAFPTQAYNQIDAGTYSDSNFSMPNFGASAPGYSPYAGY